MNAIVMVRLAPILAALVYLLAIGSNNAKVTGEQIQLSSILPKLQAIHEDAKTLLIKNTELKAKILVGLQAQNEARLKAAKEGRLTSVIQNINQPSQQAPNDKLADKKPQAIDYSELEEFNKWIEVNLDYAVKNTHASIETLKEEAQTNNGLVDYSEQAVKDGIEGVKYWQSAVIFQDKTLKNEKFDIE